MNGPTSETMQRHVEEMATLARHLEQHAARSVTLAELSRLSGYSATHLQKLFKSVFGVSPKAYHAAVRLDGFKRQLRGGTAVTDATYEAGYGSSSRAHGAARRLGMTPSVYARGGEGEGISYASRPTRFGELLMAATDRGVCFAAFADSAFGETKPPAALVEEFPRARLNPASTAVDPQLAEWVDALVAHLEHDGPHPDLPLDLRGTAFQMLVWEFLLTIPRGEVRTYKEVAQGIGRPAAVRAVANACGRNRIAVLVPCHRVLRADGALGGYRFGGELRKRALLEAEGAG